MHENAEIMKLKEENETLQKRLEMIRSMDEIRDKHEEIKEILKHGLEAIAIKLGATTVFIQFVNHYGEQSTIAVDVHGIIQKKMFKIVEEFANKVRIERKKTQIESKILQGECCYLVLPMVINTMFLGIIGIEKEDKISELDEILLQDASSVLDTAIVNECKKQLEKDKNKIVEDVDGILDEYATNFLVGLEKVAYHIAGKFNNMAVLFFGAGEEEFGIIASTHAGKIIWENFKNIQYKTMEAIQMCHEKGEYYEMKFDEGGEEYNVAGKSLKSIVAYPLLTSGDETAGTVVLFGSSEFSAGHLELVKGAASQIDTAILKEKRIEFMIKRFNRFVGMDIMDVLLQNPEWLNPRKETIIVISVDLSGSTKYANAESDALKVFSNINDYLGLVGRIIKNDYRGTLDKFIGDEVMGLFGAPVKDINCAVNGVNCALHILDKVAEFNAKREQVKKPIFEVKITLGMVNAVIGEVGSEDTQTDYTVIGNGVNEVFRIARHAAPKKIYINKALNDFIEGKYKTALVDRVNAKGFDEALAIYELMH
jgi:class 3 adenylate cyclase